MPDISLSCKIYLKSQADCDGIWNDHKINWALIYQQLVYFTFMNDAFERIIERLIPSQVIRF